LFKKPPTLYPNLTTEANIVIQTKENAMTIPRAYLAGNDSLVILADNSKTKGGNRPERLPMKVEILSGLSAKRFHSEIQQNEYFTF
jgi:HlyD family secretion protein